MNVALGVGLGRVISAAVEAEPNINLLLWSEALDDATWTKTSCSVTPQAAVDPGGMNTAEAMISAAPGAALRQVTTTAAAAGAAVTAVLAFGFSYARGSVTGTFDGEVYTFSIYARDTGVALEPAVTLRIDRSGGFLRCSIEDPVGDGEYLLAWAQLQVGAMTAYSPRGGS